jgi:hypothetical protein
LQKDWKSTEIMKTTLGAVAKFIVPDWGLKSTMAIEEDGTAIQPNVHILFKISQIFVNTFKQIFDFIAQSGSKNFASVLCVVCLKGGGGWAPV